MSLNKDTLKIRYSPIATPAEGTDGLDRIPLNYLSPGQLAFIDEILGSSEQVHRMKELGMHSGSVVEMIRPGGVCIVSHDGRRLCFRGAESIRILVRPAAEAACLERIAV